MTDAQTGVSRRLIGLGLTMMSFSSGVVDILSYRFLGQVFTSAMTGNLALMGLSIGQRDASGAAHNVTAFVSFLAGLVVGAFVLRGGHSRWRLITASLIEAVLLGAFAAFWELRGTETTAYGLITLSAIAMGIQSAVAHRIGMPGVTTTYFTGSTTNIVFGLVGTPARRGVDAGPRRHTAWPILAMLAYVAGAAASGLYTAGRSAPELSLLLPALPCAAAIALSALIAVDRR